MGCWNGSCAISNLPIFHHDEVYCFVLEEAPFSDSYCHSTTFWIPSYLFFEGQYDDYGRVENCHGLTLDLLLGEIRERLVEMDVGENQYHDIAVKKDQFNTELFFEASHEQRLRVKSHMLRDNPSGVALRHIMIRKTVLDALLEQFLIERFIVNAKTKEYKRTIFTFEDFLADAEAFVAAVLKPTDKQLTRLELSLQIGSISTLIARADDDGNEVPGHWFLSSIDHSDSHFSALGSVEAILSDLLYKIHKGPPETKQAAIDLFRAVVKQQCVHLWLGWFMRQGRRQWTPPSGDGSQDDSTSAHRTLARIVLAEGSAIDRRWDDMDDDADEDGDGDDNG